MTRYNKLVRDRIPEIIRARGKRATTHKASKREYSEKLRAKLIEESKEYGKDGDIGELADVLETVYAILELNGVSKQKLEALRAKKAQQRGSFRKRIILEKVV